jgi:transcriptional regulator with XRE-family HTH domain
MHKFGSLIRSKREENEMLLRHLAAKLDIDTAMLSKIERGERTAKRDHVDGLVNILSLNKTEAISLWLADQVYAVVADEEEALQALIVAEEEVKYHKKEKSNGV